MAFQFGFSNDEEDVADDANTSDGMAGADHPAQTDDETTHRQTVQAHRLEDLLTSFPEHISYDLIRIESPTGKVLHVPRRELYDVKVQLMREGSNEGDEVIEQLEKSDLRSGVYEGGFKTWECSLDLASLLLDRGPRKDIDELIRCDQVIELGAGSALPSLVLFQHAIQNDIPMTFTLADYNESVLRLVTVPNLVLTWAACAKSPEGSAFLSSSHEKDDLEVSPSLVQAFLSDLSDKNISLNLLSGPWSSALAALIPTSAPDMGTLVLAAETIYSPPATKAFVDILGDILKRVKMSKAMIGAKRVYFGVGGSVDGLKEACRENGAVAYEIENHGVPGMDSGVGRALVEVQMY